MHQKDSESKLYCPCCGKQIYDAAAGPDFIQGITSIIQNRPKELGEVVVTLFTIMHNPEKGESIDLEHLLGGNGEKGA